MSQTSGNNRKIKSVAGSGRGPHWHYLLFQGWSQVVRCQNQGWVQFLSTVTSSVYTEIEPELQTTDSAIFLLFSAWWRFGNFKLYFCTNRKMRPLYVNYHPVSKEVKIKKNRFNNFWLIIILLYHTGWKAATWLPLTTPVSSRVSVVQQWLALNHHYNARVWGFSRYYTSPKQVESGSQSIVVWTIASMHLVTILPAPNTHILVYMNYGE